MPRAARRFAVLLAGALLAGCQCGGAPVSPAAGGFSAADELDFGATWLGHAATRSFEVSNRSTAPLELAFELRAPAAPFSLARTSLALAGGVTAEVEVTFVPAAEGDASAEAVVRSGDEEEVVVLRGLGAAPPVCGPPPPCRTLRFDPVAGACVGSAEPDGAPCRGTSCLVRSSCQAGVCVGEARDCGDGDACTVDLCDAAAGCLHRPLSCPQPRDPCQVALCDPLVGCRTEAAADGTSCGDTDCVTAQVCLAGRCTSVRAPNGMVCSSATLCAAEGRCQEQRCVSRGPVALQPAWTYRPDAGVGLDYDVGFQLDLAGNAYLRECSPTCRASSRSIELVSLSPAGQVRFRRPVPAGSPRQPYDRVSQVVADGVVVTSANSRFLSAFDTATGAPAWTVDVSALPGASAAAVVTGLAAPAPGRVAAVVADPGTPSRTSILALSSASGALLFTLPTPSSPELIADELGNLYVEVSMGSANVVQVDPTGHVVDYLMGSVEGAAAFRGLIAGPYSLERIGRGSTPWESFGVPGFNVPWVHVVSFGPVVMDARGPVVFRTLGSGGAPLANQTGSWGIDLNTPANTWSWSSPSFDYARTPFLLANGDVGYLYATGSAFSLLVLRQGREVMRCPLGLDDLLDGALEDGRLVVMRWDVMAGYQVPGLSLAAEGWVTTRGDVTRAGRPR